VSHRWHNLVYYWFNCEGSLPTVRECFVGDRLPRPPWVLLQRIERWSRWCPERNTAACRLVAQDGPSVDGMMTRELWENLDPAIERVDRWA